MPASSLVEQGFGLTAGKIDPGYGDRNEKLVFGLKNLLDEANIYDSRRGLAYIFFVDLRGLRTIVTHNEPDWKQQNRNPEFWRAQDDGPRHDQDIDDE